MCSAKEKKGLNKVFHTAFKVVFQMKNIDKQRIGQGNAAVDPSKPPGPTRNSNGGGCCGGKK